MCLMLKLLQLQPEKEIIVEFIKNEDYKYVRVLGEAQPTCSGNLAQLCHILRYGGITLLYTCTSEGNVWCVRQVPST